MKYLELFECFLKNIILKIIYYLKVFHEFQILQLLECAFPPGQSRHIPESSRIIRNILRRARKTDVAGLLPTPNCSGRGILLFKILELFAESESDVVDVPLPLLEDHQPTADISPHVCSMKTGWKQPASKRGVCGQPRWRVVFICGAQELWFATPQKWS